jgi:hypothetical protein
MKKRQQGLTTVEAAIGAALMIVLLFGVIEIARAVFVWNFLDEATRRGARVAAVCPFNHPAVRRVAIFSTPNGSDNSPYIRNLSTNNINVEYLNAAGGAETAFEDTSFVRVSVDNFQLPLLLFNRVTLTPPAFTTILPAESMGYNPDLGTCRCFGVQGSAGAEGCDYTS